MDSNVDRKDVTEAEGIIRRMVEAAGLKNEADLARMLGKSPQAVANAKKKDRVPSAWIFQLAGEYETSVDWLVFGRDVRPQGVDGIGDEFFRKGEGAKRFPGETRGHVRNTKTASFNPLAFDARGLPDPTGHIAYFCLRLVEAQDENRTLMKAKHRLEVALIKLRNELRALKTENEKLREQTRKQGLAGTDHASSGDPA